MLPRQIRELPADLAAVLLLVAATNAFVFLPYLSESSVRVVVGLAFVLFVPGYAFVAALFPEAGEPVVGDDGGTERDPEPVVGGDTETRGGSNADERGPGPESGEERDPSAFRDRGIDGVERVALSFGLSIAIVPLVGLALNFTPFGIRLVPVMASVSLFAVAATVVAAHRRQELPREDRFRVPYGNWLDGAREEIFAPNSTLDAALNVALAVAILLAASSVVYAVAVPPQGEQFTEFYLLTEGEDGELVADDYPETFVAGEPEPLYVGIGNNERNTVEYTVVVQLQRVEGEGNESRVVERVTVDRWTATVEHNETWQQQREIAVSGAMTGEDLRLTFLLYEGSPSAEPTRENAYRDLHLWVDVEE